MDSQSVNSNPQATSQDTPKDPPAKVNETPKDDKDSPKYTRTEKEWGEMRRKMQEQINTLTVDLRAARTEIDDWKDKSDALSGKVASLQSEIESGVPDDAKEYRKKLEEREGKISKRERDFRKTQEEWDKNLAKQNEDARQKLIENVTSQFEGVDINDILELDSSDAINQYIGRGILDGTITTRGKTENQSDDKTEITENKSTPEEPLPEPLSPTGQGGNTSDEQFWKDIGKPGYIMSDEEKVRAKQIYDRNMRGG